MGEYARICSDAHKHWKSSFKRGHYKRLLSLAAKKQRKGEGK